MNEDQLYIIKKRLAKVQDQIYEAGRDKEGHASTLLLWSEKDLEKIVEMIKEARGGR